MGEKYSINTTHTISNPIWRDNSDFVLHIGDISYARGYLSEWDDFLNQIEPISSYLPYQTGIGNHEYSYSKGWSPNSNNGNNGNYTYDLNASHGYYITNSGGECGVPYFSLFPFASQNGESKFRDRLPWYSIEYARIKIIIMSTESNFSIGSLQYNWIENEVNNTDRNIFPWIILTGHRMMYCNSLGNDDLNIGKYMRNVLEKLMIKYKVTIGIWGHSHMYTRTCAVFNATCVGSDSNKNGNGQAPIHLVVGSAGYESTDDKWIPNPWYKWVVANTNKHYGFVHLQFLNDTHCLGKFVESNSSKIFDQFYVLNMFH